MNKTTRSVYRIFLSSTAIDMVEHRKKVIDAILRLGDLPVAMETFGALPNEPVRVCKNKVRESNALVVMVAHRYGWVPSMDEGGVSKKVPGKNPLLARYFFCHRDHRDHREKSFLTSVSSVSSVANLFGCGLSALR